MTALVRRSIKPFIGLAATLTLLGCEQKQDAAPPPAYFEAESSVEIAAVDRHTQGVWLQGISLIDASLAQTRQLRNAVEVLLNDPSEETLSEAREAWHQSHNAYLASELFTALSGSNPGLFGNLGEYDFAIEAWPIQPGYLDYFDVYKLSGIVNDVAMPLTAEALRQQHGFTDHADVSLGFHAMEYLLWGENGQRPVSDYEERSVTPEQAAAEIRAVDLPNNRRRVYLRLLANLLLDDLEAYKDAVENPNGLLRRSYSALHPYSRVLLFKGAAQAMLSHHRDLLQAQLDSHIAGEGDPLIAAEIQHNPYAGSNAQHLSYSLATLRQVLLDSKEGLGEWLSEAENGEADTAELLASLEGKLSAMENENWPPIGEKGVQVLNDLTLLSERFEARDRAEWQR